MFAPLFCIATFKQFNVSTLTRLNKKTITFAQQLFEINTHSPNVEARAENIATPTLVARAVPSNTDARLLDARNGRGRQQRARG